MGMSLVLASVFMLMVLGLSYSGISHRSEVPVPLANGKAPDVTIAKSAYHGPVEIIFPGGKDVGPVTFRHDSHVDLDAPNCVVCHTGKFPLLTRSVSSSPMEDRHSKQQCGGCHNGKTAFSMEEDCTYCHQ
jgi:c(7)-type cytochrome triheme protein